MFTIGEAIVEDAIARERFACDLGRCHGACCTLPGGRGAPLEDAELQYLVNSFPAAKKYLPPEHLQVIETDGLYEGEPGSYATTCIDEQACVFVFYEEGIAKCSFERARLNGETTWLKPLSCHLFPIRISSLFSERLRYETIAECKPALRRGAKEDVPLYEFLREPLLRKFGQAWYDEFLLQCRMRDPARNQTPSGK